MLYSELSRLKTLHWLILVTIVWAVMLSESLLSAMTVWVESKTFNHCFFVIPISLYLIYASRLEWLSISARFEPIMLFPVFVALLVWLFGFAGNIDVLTHLAAFSLLPMLWALFCGRNFARKTWFPLVFVMFSVPLGEELVPFFQEVTATISVRMLEWSGVAVFREGLFIQIPEGRFLVAEACSGVRFFVSTLMLGALLSYLQFHSLHKRILFMLFAVALPVIANAIRAYGIMMVGHITNMEHAVGADHLVYGWFFFAIVTGLLVFVGYRFGEPHQGECEKKEITLDNSWNEYPSKPVVIISFSVLVGFSVWKAVIVKPVSSPFVSSFGSLDFDANIFNQGWRSKFPEASLSKSYSLPVDQASAVLRYHAYLQEGRDKELISWKNRIYDPDKWTLVKQSVISSSGFPIKVLNVVSGAGRKRTIAFWYDVPGFKGASRVKTKLQQSLNILLGRGGDGAVFIISAEGKDFLESEFIVIEAVQRYREPIERLTPW